MAHSSGISPIKTKILISLAAIFCSVKTLNAQLSGTYSVPATYSTVASAVNALNLQGVNGPVTILVDAGYTETVQPGGITVTASGTSANTITFQKNGAGPNPILVAYSGTATPASASQDGVFKLVGSDYVTIDAIDILDPNTTNPETMEFGYGFFKASASNGCQNNTIKNCHVKLSSVNNAAGSGPSADGSRGINVANSLVGSQLTNVAVSSVNGANSKNKFYSNTIESCNIGIALIGYAAPSPYSNSDQFNDVGGNSILTGNTVINFGGGGSVSPSAGVRTLNQHNLNISFNTLNSNNGNGLAHQHILRGVFVGASAGANTSILNNTVSVAGGGTTQVVAAIENNSGSTAANNTITITGNLVTNCTYSTAASAPFYGIFNSGAASYLAINSNTITSNSTNASGGNQYIIYNSGAIAVANSISNNNISDQTFAAATTSLVNYNIFNSAAGVSSSLTISGNHIQNINYTGNSTGAWAGIIASGSSSMQTIQNNNFDNLSIKTSGVIYLLSSSNTSPNSQISGNIIVGGFARNSGGNGALYGIFNGANSTAGNTANIFSNNFSNINNGTGTGAVQMIYWATNPNLNIYNNTFTNIAAPSGTVNFAGLYAHYYSANTNIYNNIVSDVVYGTGAVYGLFFNELNGQSANVYENSFYNFKNNGTTNAGIFINYSGTNGNGIFNFHRNRISDIGSNAATAGGVSGITINSISGGSVNVYNNLIANITATAASNITAISGINISSASASLTSNISFNTVYLNSSSSGVNFGSSGINSNTGSNLILRNNIIVNNSTPSGTGRTAALRRSSTNINTYSTLSNNNLFYAGVPSLTRLIFYDGTSSYQSLSAYQAATINRDGLSVTENPVLLSTSSLNADFLKPDPAVATQIENWGTPIAGIALDYTLTPRNTAAPDLGAWEGNYLSSIPGCTGAPSGAMVLVSQSSVCANTPVQLSLSSSYTNTGISIQWEASGTGAAGSYVSIPNATTSVHTATGITASTWFRAIITCTNSAISATATPGQVIVTGNGCSCLSYCTSSATAVSDEDIFNVSIGTLSNSSTCSQTGGSGSILNQYSNYTGMIAPPSLVNGITYTLSVTAGQCSGSQWSGRVAAYIDYNQNGLFTDGGENVLLTAFGPIQISGTTFSAGVTIPQGALPGITRMRVVVVENSVISPCGSYGLGETEDYCVRIGFPPCTGTPSQNTITASTPFVCQTGTVALSLSDSYSLTGLDYQWSVASASVGPYSLLPGGGSASYTVTSPTVSGWYQSVVTCTNSALSSTAVPVYINVIPNIQTSATPNKICAGETATLSAAGPSSYTWSSGTVGSTDAVTPGISTIYTVTAEDSGCTGTATVGITVYALPGVTLTASSYTACTQDHTVSLDGFPVGGSYSGIFVTGNVFGPATNGTYTPVYIYTDTTTGCSNSDSINIVVIACTALSEFSDSYEVKVYPNPATHSLHIDADIDTPYSLKLTDVAGKILIEENINSNSHSVYIEVLPPGMYLLIISNSQGKHVIKVARQ